MVLKLSLVEIKDNTSWTSTKLVFICSCNIITQHYRVYGMSLHQVQLGHIATLRLHWELHYILHSFQAQKRSQDPQPD